MARIVHLIPKPGTRVLDPNTLLPLPPEGEQKLLDSYWLRRVSDGDVEIQPEPQAKPKPSASGGKAASAPVTQE